jgi:hypothetical protein
VWEALEDWRPGLDSLPQMHAACRSTKQMPCEDVSNVFHDSHIDSGRVHEGGGTWDTLQLLQYCIFTSAHTPEAPRKIFRAEIVGPPHGAWERLSLCSGARWRTGMAATGRSGGLNTKVSHRDTKIRMCIKVYHTTIWREWETGNGSGRDGNCTVGRFVWWWEQWRLAWSG